VRTIQNKISFIFIVERKYLRDIVAKYEKGEKYKRKAYSYNLLHFHAFLTSY